MEEKVKTLPQAPENKLEIVTQALDEINSISYNEPIGKFNKFDAGYSSDSVTYFIACALNKGTEDTEILTNVMKSVFDRLNQDSSKLGIMCPGSNLGDARLYKRGMHSFEEDHLYLPKIHFNTTIGKGKINGTRLVATTDSVLLNAIKEDKHKIKDKDEIYSAGFSLVLFPYLACLDEDVSKDTGIRAFSETELLKYRGK